MGDRHHISSGAYSYIDQAHQQRAETMARAGYLAVTGLGAAVQCIINAGARTLRGVLRAAAEWHARRVALRALQRLDDRLLRDVGLTRFGLWDAVNGGLDRGFEAPRTPAPYVDIALSGYALAGCNDNKKLHRAA